MTSIHVARRGFPPMLAALFTLVSIQAHPAIRYSAVEAGDSTNHSVILWTRTVDDLTGEGVAVDLRADVAADPQLDPVLYYFSGQTDPDRDYTLKLDADGFEPGTRYYYRFQSPDGDWSPAGTFTTAPSTSAGTAIRFGFSGDVDGKWRPYVLTADFAGLNLDFYIHLGDTMYETVTRISPPCADPYLNPAQALLDYRRKYLENITPVTADGFASLQVLFASQVNYTLLDNHELGNRQFQSGGAPTGEPPGAGADSSDPANDVNTTGAFMNQTQGFLTLMRAYDDYQPVRETRISAPDDPRTDGTQRQFYAQNWGASLIFINVDDRSYRDIRMTTPGGQDDTGPRADNPARTMLGATQLAWLERTLIDAHLRGVRWKIVAVSSPMDEVGAGGDNAKTWVGNYRAERTRLLRFIAIHQINNVVFLTTDAHQYRVNELTYPDPADPTHRIRVPFTFHIMAGPLGAGGPELITDHSFDHIKALADTLAATEESQGIDPIGLDPNYPGLHDVFRDGDPEADALRQPVDFYSPDTFNYAVLSIDRSGKTLSVELHGIDSYAADTFPEPSQLAPSRLISAFQIDAQ